MIFKTFDIQVDYAKAGLPASEQHPHVDCYIPDIAWQRDDPASHMRPGFVICPGGGYGFVCGDREGEPIALKFAAMGIPSFVVTYSIAPARYPSAQLEACYAIALVRSHAAEWGVDPDNIHIGGFSAGGHLSASVGTLWNQPVICDTLGFHNGEHRPNGLVLSYPVITAVECTAHMGSFLNLLGHQPDEEETQFFSCDQMVGEHTPRAFLWHTLDDNLVPVNNSLLFASALDAHHIPFELHIYPHGPHGLALCDRVTGSDNMIVPEAQDWCQRAAAWMFRK